MRLILSAAVIAVVLAACSLTTYKDPARNLPSAPLTVTSSGQGFEIYTLFKDASCQARGSNFAWFNGSGKSETIRLPTGERLFILSGHRIATGVRATGRQIEVDSYACQYMTSFIPQTGHAYTYRHTDSPQTSCAVEVVDLQTGAPPETFQIHPAIAGCKSDLAK